VKVEDGIWVDPFDVSYLLAIQDLKDPTVFHTDIWMRPLSDVNGPIKACGSPDVVAALINAHRERVQKDAQLALDLIRGKKPDKGDEE